MLTSCPFCSATFRVSQQQLDAAEGMVRCGDCDGVFNAAEHLVAEHTPAPTNEEISQRYINDMLLGGEPDSTTMPPAVFESEPEPEVEPEPEPELESRAAPAPESEQAPASELTPVAQQETEASTDTTESPAETNEDQTLTSVLTDLPDADDAVNLEQIGSPPVEVIHTAPALTWRQRLPWLAGSAACLLLLLAQYGWSQRESPTWRPVVTTACAVLGCELPLRSEIQLIRSDSLSVRQSPDDPAIMLLDLIITNYANFDQPLPTLELVFTDIDNLPSALLRVTPTQYLEAGGLSLRSMKSRLPLRLSLQFESPGEQMTNYRLYLRESID